MANRFEVDSPFPADNDIRRLAQVALEAVEKPKDPSRTPDDVGVGEVD